MRPSTFRCGLLALASCATRATQEADYIVHTTRAEELATSCWMRGLSEGRWVEALPPMELRYGPAIVPAAGDIKTIAHRKNHKEQCAQRGYSGAAPTLSCFSTAQRYSWQPLLPLLQAQNRTRVVHHLFCATMHRLHISRISMLGDSVTWGMVQSLWMMMGVTSKLPRYQTATSGSVACPHGMVTFLIHNSTGSLSPWAARIAGLATNGTLTVINMGAHFSAAKGRSNGLSDFTSDLQLFAAALAAMSSRGLVVWRSMHVPHPGCEEEDDPWPPELSAIRMERSQAQCMNTSRLPPSSCPKTRTGNNGYDWDLYPEYDQRAHALLAPLGVRFLNITRLSHMRPDAHSKIRYGCGRLPPDCSHLAVPGVPDWWNLMLLWRIAKCEK